MLRLWLTAALLLFSASAVSSVENPEDQNNNQAPFPRPDETQLKEIVDDLRNRYRPFYQSRLNFQWSVGDEGNIFQEKLRKGPMFSLAVGIPYDNKTQKYNVSRVTDDPKTVKNTIIGCDVYTSNTMVTATVLKWKDVLDQCPNAQVPWQDVLNKCNKPLQRMTWQQVYERCSDRVKVGRADHAEYRVLQNFNTLTNKLNKTNFLLFYVFASPCDRQCASEDHVFSILEKIKVIKNWANYALVFSKVFKPKNGNQASEKNLKGALERLGKQIGLNNIYRCDVNRPCTRCSSGNDVTPYCYDQQRRPISRPLH